MATTVTRNWFARIAREPFFQFMLLGSLIWIGVEHWSTNEQRYTIDVGPAEQRRIVMAYQQQFGREPTAEQLRMLIERYIREEIFLREGLDLDLDQDDEIVRRRIVQKYEFLQTDLAVPNSPAEAELQRWFELNKARYMTPAQVSFSHTYFSVDRDGEQGAKQRAAKAMHAISTRRVARAPDVGDPFPGPSDVSALAPDEASRLFGQSELSEQLFKLPPQEWSGPYRSGYGWHLVFLNGRSPPAAPAFAEVRERVLADYVEEQRRQHNERNFAKLREKYQINYGGSSGEAAP